MTERRRSRRLRSWFVTNLKSSDRGEWLAMSRNVSQWGAQLATAGRLIVGQDVTLSFKLTPEDEQVRELQGTIVRVEVNAEDPSGMWPHRVAVEFDDLAPELEQALEADSGSWSDAYLIEMEEGAD